MPHLIKAVIELLDRWNDGTIDSSHVLESLRELDASDDELGEAFDQIDSQSRKPTNTVLDTVEGPRITRTNPAGRDELIASFMFYLGLGLGKYSRKSPEVVTLITGSWPDVDQPFSDF